jgi:hypothetical protein
MVPRMHPSADTGRLIAGRYRLQAPVGRGAMGVVWRARDELLDREVAVKEVQVAETLTESERVNAYRRTLREAKTAARLNHPAVVAVYDVAEDGGRPWIVMQLVAARSLDQVLATSGPLSPRRAAEMGRQLLSALSVAHAAGVLHRDVKPSNVLLGADDRAVLTDFGIATFTGDPRLTQTGMVMGSPGFTAPERIRGGDASPASDLWSLGATLFAAVEGHGPFDRRGGAITTMSAIINEDAPAAAAAGPLGPVIAALLRREPADRPDAATAARMICDVLPLLPQRAAAARGHAPAAVAAAPQPVARAAAPAETSLDLGPADRATSPEPPHPVPAGAAEPTVPQPALGDLPPPDFSSWYGPAPRPGAGPAPPAPRGDGGPEPPRRRGGPWRKAALAALGILGVAAGATTFALLRNGTASAPAASAAEAAALPPASLQIVGAINDRARGAPPAGWTIVTRPASGSQAAGFTMARPAGWTVSASGNQTDLRDPAAAAYVQVDLTPHTFPHNMVAEARYIRDNALAQGHFPGYRQLGSITAADIRGTRGAYWTFTWDDQGVTQEVLDLLFVLPTPAGPQSYALYFTAPAGIWTSMHPVFDEQAETFAPLA